MSNIGTHRPTVSTIDLDALAFNYRSARAFIGESTRCMAVVKADAYGHGSVECSRRLESEGIEWFGVALPEEAVTLREAGITRPILSLGGFWPGQEALLIKHLITPAITRIEHAELLDRASAERGVTTEFHVKLDTGMGRIGVRWDEAADFASKLQQFPNIRLEALMTHFAAADDLSENEFTDEQLGKFDQTVAVFIERGMRPDFVDIANSPGAVAHEQSRRDMVRLGGVLYGLGGDVLPKGIPVPELRPVLSLTSEIAQLKSVPAGESIGYGRSHTVLRDSKIATVPVGYADGYPRGLSNCARVLINGEFAPVVGRVSMDWTIVDVTDIADPQIGSEVVLIGRSGGNLIRSEDLAANLGTISYEITCRIKDRVFRRFTEST
jgi:alanine racemase